MADRTEPDTGRRAPAAGLAGARMGQHIALAECSAALLRGDQYSDIQPALAVVLEALDGATLFVGVNVEDPFEGLCRKLVHAAAAPGVRPASSEGTTTPYSTIPNSYTALSAGRPMVVRSDDDGPAGRATLAAEGSSSMTVPIFVGEEWHGVIGVTDGPQRGWTDDDVLLLETTAGMIGAFWEKLDSLGALRETADGARRLLRYQQALSECAAALLAGQSDAALNSALTALARVTETACGFVAVNAHDDEGELCCTEVARTHSHEVDDATTEHDEFWRSVPWSQMPDSYERLSNGKAFEVTLGTLGPVERAHYGNDPNPVVSEIDIPIHVDGEWGGILGFTDHDEERSWTPDVVDLLETAATMIGAYWSRQRAAMRLEGLLRSKDEFLAGVSHELRTPLTSVVGLALELRDYPGKFTETDRHELIGLIASEGQEMANLVEDLLVAARQDIDALPLVLQPCVLDRQIRTVLAGLTPEPDVEVTCEPGCAAFADPVRVRQIVRNLLTNAVRHGHGRIRVTASRDRDAVSISVSDDGPRIEDPVRIFEPYERRVIVGGQPASVGLGLTISRRLARLMGGDIDYQHVTRRSIFTLRLPAAQAPA